MGKLSFLRLNGEAAENFGKDLAALRLNIFKNFPYLYEGTIDYEMKYLQTYFKAKHSFIFLVLDGEKVVGATTSIWSEEEEESFKRPFEEHNFDPKKVFYFGESVLEPAYRGKGLGKLFFQERESFARSLGFIDTVSFCAVVREGDHPLKPADYKPLDAFWRSQGFEKVPGMTTTYEWQDRDQDGLTKKLMQFWAKSI